MKYDFDQVIDRRNTNSVKYDFAAECGMPEDALPLWVADMDFRVPEAVSQRLEELSRFGIYGYSNSRDDYFATVKKWYSTHFQWEPKKEWLIKTPGVVFAIAAAIRAFTEPGEGVLIQQPVYYPFRNTILANDRECVNSPLVLEDGRYRMDLVDMEQKIKDSKVKLFILCSPHNPVGRVWTKEELEAVGELCEKYDVLIVSDEIHSDFTYGARTHTVFPSISPELADRTILCTAPSKTFNLAGLLHSNIIIRSDEERARFQARDKNIGAVNPLSIAAHKAAYEHGGAWLEQLKAYVDGNLALVDTFLRENIPGAKFTVPEATYFAWVDLGDVLPQVEDLPDFFANKAGVLLEGGDGLFVGNAKGYIRLNLAMPRATVQTGLERIAAAIRAQRADG